MPVYTAEYTAGKYVTELIIQAVSLEDALKIIADQTAHLADVVINRLALRPA
jgi:hypothetical protein